MINDLRSRIDHWRARQNGAIQLGSDVVTIARLMCRLLEQKLTMHF